MLTNRSRSELTCTRPLTINYTSHSLGEVGTDEHVMYPDPPEGETEVRVQEGIAPVLRAGPVKV